MMCHYLTVRSLLEAKEYNDALQVINEFEMCSNVTANVNHSNDFAADIEDTPKNVCIQNCNTQNTTILKIFYNNVSDPKCNFVCKRTSLRSDG